MKNLALFLVCLVAAAARAADSTLTDAQLQQLEEARGQVADQVQFQAYHLLDDLVFEWSEHPPFDAETPLVMADVSVPVDFGSGLQALIENHVTALLTKQKGTHVVLTHCPACTAMVVRSSAKGTIVSRGVDDPVALAQAGALTHTRHALFLDFEMEGDALVLRVRITSLEPSLPIVYARTLTTTTSAPALLRDPDHLKSAADARQEYLDILENRSRWSVPIHLGVRSYATRPFSNSTFVPVPFIWLQVGVEASITQARAWLASFSLGVTWLPQLHIGVSANARISRLITGSTSSMTHPDLYAFVGGTVFFIQGNSALGFKDEIPDINTVIANARGAEPQALFGSYQVGLELRLKNRIGFAVYLEALPALDNAVNIGSYVDLGIKFQSLGAEVLFCF